MKNKFSIWFSTIFKIGYLPIAPGTWGSLAALLIWYAIVSYISSITLIALIVIIFVFGVYTSSETEGILGKKDPSIIVIDEWVGQWIALMFLPKSFVWGIVAFAFFRLFDIWKPFPINKLDNIKGGYGIMLDDVLAGVYALIGVHTLRYFLL